MKGCRGEAHKCAKLNEEKVRYIRASNLDSVLLAAEFNVSPMTVSKIKRRKLWKHVQ